MPARARLLFGVLAGRTHRRCPNCVIFSTRPAGSSRLNSTPISRRSKRGALRPPFLATPVRSPRGSSLGYCRRRGGASGSRHGGLRDSKPDRRVKTLKTQGAPQANGQAKTKPCLPSDCHEDGAKTTIPAFSPALSTRTTIKPSQNTTEPPNIIRKNHPKAKCTLQCFAECTGQVSLTK